MIEIKQTNWLSHSKTKKMIPFLNKVRNNNFLNFLLLSPLGILHKFLPQQHKFLDETYILKKDNEIKGFITVTPIIGNHYKLSISKLFFEEYSYDVAKDLINFIVTKYGEIGISTFYVAINQVYDELINTFISQCGFRQCSNEQIWGVKKIYFKKSKNIKYRRYKDSDLEDVASIYNDSVITYYKPTLNRSTKEFGEFICNGLTYSSDYRYVIEDYNTGKIIGYFLISTNDNKNYLVDFNYSDGYEVDLDGIMHFATREILKRIRHFKLHLKIKNYLKTGEYQQKYVKEKKFKCIQTKLMLIKDFYKQIKEINPPKNILQEFAIKSN